MKIFRMFRFILSLLLFCTSFGLMSQSLNLMPLPADIELGRGQFKIEQNFEIGFVSATDRLFGYATRFLRRLDGKTGEFFTQNQLGNNDDNENASLFIRIQREGLIELYEDESYELDITSEAVNLVAVTDIGAMRGLETLLQLVESDVNGYYFPVVKIRDEPRFPWRGLLIDFGRHWIPLDVVKRNIDGMALVKMNVLHMHLTEDQGFRIESLRYPKLHELGSDGKYFTQEEIKHLIGYAGDRGIRIVPEFDLPGHTTSWFVGYPGLASAPGPYQIETDFGVQDPTMDPTKESTYRFLENFFDEMTSLFPDEYVHIGGDENNGNQWDSNVEIQKFMRDNGFIDNHELQRDFNSRLLEILEDRGKKMMGWDEIFQPGISTDIMIQSWRGRSAMIESAQMGYKTILSNGYYIDLMQPASFHYQNDPIPADTPLSSREQSNILGGEAAMWTEIVSEETIDSRIWPRTAAIAERLWSPPDVTDVDDMYNRLKVISVALEDVGLMHEKNVNMMLRRLVGSDDITVLKTLVDVIEPLEGYARHGKIDFQTYTPLTRLADAAKPEASVAREFQLLVDSFVSGNSDVIQDIKDHLLKWVENHRQFKEVVENAPIIKESEKLSLDLSNISKVGLQALSKTVKHSEDWKQKANRVLDSAKTPHMECELKVVDSIRKLVEFSK